jgi:hypothetical protein
MTTLSGPHGISRQRVSPLCLSCPISVHGVGQKNSCTAANQKRSNHSHKQHSRPNKTFLAPFDFSKASWDEKKVSSGLVGVLPYTGPVNSPETKRLTLRQPYTDMQTCRGWVRIQRTAALKRTDPLPTQPGGGFRSGGRGLPVPRFNFRCGAKFRSRRARFVFLNKQLLTWHSADHASLGDRAAKLIGRHGGAGGRLQVR